MHIRVIMGAKRFSDAKAELAGGPVWHVWVVTSAPS